MRPRGDMSAAMEAKRRVIVDIGLSKELRRNLERLTHRGEIAKWLGYWFPIAGAPIGIGPLKTCFGPKSTP